MISINCYAPLKLVKHEHKYKNKEWFDHELFLSKRKCDKIHNKFMKKPNLFNNQLFLDQRQLYQSMLRDKKTKFYLTTTHKDVKNSKLFWEFYQNEMKIKSDKSNYKTPNSILFNNKILSNDDDITDAFNKHFSSFVSENNDNDI